MELTEIFCPNCDKYVKLTDTKSYYINDDEVCCSKDHTIIAYKEVKINGAN